MWDACRELGQLKATPGTANFGLVDGFSLLHGGVGLVLALAGLGFLPTIFLAVAWEFAEHLLKDCAPALFLAPSQDTLLNSVGDVGSTVFGFGVGRMLRAARHHAAGSTGAMSNER